MACLVPPGDVQVDTFTLGGGNPSENFWWILDGTDRLLQWTWMAPCWNRGADATIGVLGHIGRKFPFPIRSIHSDNGGEFINHHLLRVFPSLFPKEMPVKTKGQTYFFKTKGQTHHRGTNCEK